MLLLTRKKGESIDLVLRETEEVIATFQIVEILPNGVVRVGIEADQDIQIRRDNMRSREDGTSLISEIKGKQFGGS